jgi:4-hydroxy-3-methylbut-2-enyl diphosphate reductase
MGQSADGMFLVETVADVGQLQVRTPQQLAYVTQTTLSVDDAASIIAALKERFPEIQGPKKDDICYATQSRQDAVKEIAESCDVAIIVGSTNSSNSNRLREVAQKRGVQSYLVDSAAEIDAAWLAGKSRVGISAGASAPEILVSRVMARIAEISPAPQIVVTGVEEQVFFPLPKELQTV